MFQKLFPFLSKVAHFRILTTCLQCYEKTLSLVVTILCFEINKKINKLIELEMIFLPFTLYHLFQNICSWTLYKVVSSSQIILPGLLLSAFLFPPFPSTALLTEVSLLNCLEMIKQLSSSHFPCSSLFTLHFLSSFSTLALLSEIMVFSYVFSLLPSPPTFLAQVSLSWSPGPWTCIKGEERGKQVVSSSRS